MAPKRILHFLEERGRYYCQRQIRKALIHVLKMDRWHRPVGGGFETAADRVKDFQREHDALIARAKSNPDFMIALRRDGKTRLRFLG